MTASDPWIAVDWGTSNLRATLMDGAAPGETRTAPDGMGTLGRDGFAPALARITEGWPDAPVLAAGMVGARQGWHEAPYRAVPCAPAGAPVAVPGTRVAILPGLSQLDPHPDVMRGEETQIAGVLATAPAFDGCVLLPGTHAKWVHVSAGEVVSFITTMAGECMALLSERSVLRHSVSADGWDDAAFLDAVARSRARPEAVMARLFRIRAADLLHGVAPEAGRATLAGLLIGAELAAARPWWMGREVVIVGAERASAAYAAALRAEGVTTRRIGATEATLAGLAAARSTAWDVP